MENRLLLSGVVSLFIFAAIIGSVTMTGHVIGDGDEKPEPVCMEKWNCSEWSECIDALQVRECKDLNECGTTELKPPVEQECDDREWQRVKLIIRDEDTTTDYFHIPHDIWRISWECSDIEGEDNQGRGLVYISVYEDGGKKPIASSHAKCEDFENWNEPLKIDINKSGWFYIDVQVIDISMWWAEIEQYM